MKLIAVCSALVVTVAAIAFSQPPRNDNDGRRPPMPPPDPYLQLFDTDRDGEISEEEIENAAKVLKSLDRDQNGSLSRDELPRPPRPGDERRDGFQPEGGPPRRDNRKQGNQVEKNLPKGTVVFRGGFETDPRDNGRPVSLIAAALKVKPEVFRDAFSRVKPARNGRPTPERAQANKKVLMDALSKYGVTNDRLDEVSNYYRYNPSQEDVWRSVPARATAIIEDGKVTGFRITNAGAGYTIAPTISIVGYENVNAKASIEFSTEFDKNGRVASLSVVEK